MILTWSPFSTWNFVTLWVMWTCQRNHLVMKRNGICTSLSSNEFWSSLKNTISNLVSSSDYLISFHSSPTAAAISLDTDALYDILKIAQNPLVAGVTKTQFGQDAHNNWRQVFDVAKYGDRFRCYLETDTTAVSILVTKPTLPSTQTDWDTIDITGKVVVGLDPGRRDLFNTCDSRERVSSCSTKEYRAMAGFIKNRRKLKGWLRRAPHIQHLTNDLPTSRTSSKDAFLIHCHSAISEYPALHDFFGAPRFRNLAFSNYVGKQKALSKLCRRIIGKIKDWFHADVMVAFGGGRFSSSSRGHATGPIKQLFHQLKRRCITKYVSEFRTSQVCADFLVRYLFML